MVDIVSLVVNLVELVHFYYLKSFLSYMNLVLSIQMKKYIPFRVTFFTCKVWFQSGSILYSSIGMFSYFYLGDYIKIELG